MSGERYRDVRRRVIWIGWIRKERVLGVDWVSSDREKKEL
jgi:hypothetical protein